MPELDGAVLDAPIESGPALEPEPESHEAEGRSEEPDRQEGAPKDASQSAPIASDPKQVHQAVRASLAEIRAKNPAAAQALKDGYYLKQDLEKEGFRDITEVRAFKAQMAELGEPDAIRESMGELSWFKEMDNDFTAANPQVWDRIAEAAPEQFVKLFPAMTDKVEGLAPDAFASWFASRSIADMDQFGLRQDIQWLQRVAGDNAEVKAIADKFAGYIQRMSGFASKPFAAPKGNAQQAQQPDATAQRERDLNIREFRGENQTNLNQMYASELGKHLSGRTATPEQKAAIAELVTSALNRAETADDRKKIDRYFAAGDKKGYLAFKKSIRDRALPGAVASAVAVTVGRKTGPKPVAAIQPKLANGRPAPVAAQGIKQVTAEPDRNSVKWGRGGTTPDDVMKGIYRLRDGSTVQWRG